MPTVHHIKIKPRMGLAKLAEEMRRTGVLGAGRFGRAVELVREMFADGEYTNFLAIAGPIVPAGQRAVIRYLVDRGHLNAIVTSGANVTHDIIEALGRRHIVTRPSDDEKLRKRHIGRIYDIGVSDAAFRDLEKKIYRILDQIPEEQRSNIPSFKLLWEVGRRLKDPNSILKTAERRRVPIFCPGIHDSMLGLNLWTYSQLKKLHINHFLDFSEMVEMAHRAKKVGAIFLGGGLPKHHVLAANIFRGGLDCAVQITLDRPEGGSASGAPLEEAISWGKIKSKRNLVSVIGDSTLIFPLLVSAAIDGIDH